MIINFLRRIPVPNRIIGGFAILLAILAVSIPLIVANHLALTARVQQLSEVDSKSDRLLLLSLSRVLSSRVNLMRYADDLSPSVSESMADVTQAVQYIEEARTLIETPDQKTALAKILAGMVSYSTLISDVQNARYENRLQEVPTLLSNSYQLEFDLEQQIRAVVNNNEIRVDTANKAALAEAQQRLVFLVTVYIGLLLLALVIAFFIQKSITEPISALRKGIEEFRLSQKETSIPSGGSDEFSLLANAFNQITADLGRILFGLEQRVDERTRALTTVSEISTAASTILDIDVLLQEAVNLSKERFGLYHAHIYLLDDAGENLVLASGAGEPGRQMVAQGRLIPLNQERSLVARAARDRRGVTVNDVTLEPDFLPNPLLPDTRSELAVPMIVGEKVIGVFDIQSDVTGRFTEADIDIQTTLASQVATAVQNAKLFEQTQAALLQSKEAQQLTSDVIDSTDDWIFIKDQDHRYRLVNQGYAKSLHIPKADFIGKNDLDLGFPEDLVKGNPEKGISGFWADDRAVMDGGVSKNIPDDVVTIDGEIRVFDTVKIPLHNADNKVWGVLAFARDMTERRNLEEITHRRAEQEEALNRITHKIQGTTSIEDALKITARELGHILQAKTSAQLIQSDQTISNQ